MDLFINGASRSDLLPTDAKDYKGILKHVAEALHHEGHLVAGIQLDGEEITGQRQDEEVDLSHVKRMDIHSRTPSAMACASLELSREWLVPLEKQIRVCVDFMRLGQDEQGLEAFMQVINGIEILLYGSAQALRMISSHFPDLDISDTLAFAEKMPEQLDELIEAQQRRDWTMLADLLEYKLLDYLQSWSQKAGALEKILENLHV